MILDTLSPLWDTLNPMRFVMSFAEGDGGGGDGGGDGGDGGGQGGGGDFSFKSHLPEDMRNSPTMQKYEDNPNGLVGMGKALLDLTHMLGHEKVVIPKDPNDATAWAHFNKAMGVPDQPSGYTLGDVKMPEAIQGVTFDKQAFAEVAHQLNLRPDQAGKLWDVYTKTVLDQYNKVQDSYVKTVEQTRADLMKEWGDAFNSKVDLGQKVIQQFAGDEQTAAWLTENILKDPRGAKFFAKIGENFAEHQIGDFDYKRQTLTPREAQSEYDAIMANPKHPYNDHSAPQDVHEQAVEHVNMLLAIIAKASETQ